MQSSQSKSNIQKANILLIGETHGNHKAISYENVGMVINNQVYDAFCDAMKKGNLDKSFAIGREFFRSLDSSDVTSYDRRKCWTDLKQYEQNNITQNFIQNFEASQGDRDEHYTNIIQEEITSGKKNIIVMAGIDHIIKLQGSLTGHNITTIETMNPTTMKRYEMTDDEFDTNKTLIFADNSIKNMSRAIQQWVSKQQSVSQSNMSNIVDGNIATQRDNTVLSPALVDGVCGKIKQQEQQKFSLLDMSNNSFVASENKHNISDVAQENKGWFHKAVGVPFLDFISCCKNNNDNYNMNL